MTTRFFVSTGDPDQHLFHVRLVVDQRSTPADFFDLRMPAWVPGSYMVREYARHVQRVRAQGPDGQPLQVIQQDKASWRVMTQGLGAFTLEYEVYAFDINVRANHLDDSHGFFNGVSLFMFNEAIQHEPVHLELDCPSSWRVFTGLQPLDDSGRRFRAVDFDELFDCPVELGPHTPLEFKVRGVPHTLVFWGTPIVDLERLVQDTTRIIEANADLFDGQLPYEHYTFVVLLAPGGRGGLEHRNSTILYWDGLQLRDGGPGSELKDGMPHGAYLNFLRLVSHEHFHTWNVKRIRPMRLGPFDYSQENYTRDLWTVEGITSYYELVSLHRAGLLSGAEFLKILAQSDAILRDIPGRQLHSLEDASFNAWVKLYRPDENTRNSSVSYYLKGELVSFMLDAYIRGQTRGERSLDDVLSLLWTQFKETGQGYPEGGYDAIVEQATGISVSAWLAHHTRTTRELDWEQTLKPLGLELIPEPPAEALPWLGVQTRQDQGRLVLSSVNVHGPAYKAGLYAHDELVAIDGRRVSADNLSALLKLYPTDAQVQLHLFRRGELIVRTVNLEPTPPKTLRFVAEASLRDDQHALLNQWLGFVPEGRS